MKKTTIATIALAVLIAGPGHVQGQADECIPSGEKKVLVSDSGQSTDRWIVAELSKPNGSALRAHLEVFGFQSTGPGLATMMVVEPDGTVRDDAVRRADDYRAGAHAQAEADPSIGPLGASPLTTSELVSRGTLMDHGFAHEDSFDELYWVAAFATDADQSFHWELEVSTVEDNCGNGDPMVSYLDGPEATLYTAEDLDGRINVGAGAYTPIPVVPVEGARAHVLDDAAKPVGLQGEPLTAWAWRAQEGDGAQVQTPSGSLLEDVGACSGTPNYDACAGWGASLAAGEYVLQADGQSLPEPTKPWRHNQPGPYFLTAETIAP